VKHWWVPNQVKIYPYNEKAVFAWNILKSEWLWFAACPCNWTKSPWSVELGCLFVLFKDLVLKMCSPHFFGIFTRKFQSFAFMGIRLPTTRRVFTKLVSGQLLSSQLVSQILHRMIVWNLNPLMVEPIK
jgi:hypothetical protein